MSARSPLIGAAIVAAFTLANGSACGSTFDDTEVEVELSDGTLIGYPVERVTFTNGRGEALLGVLIRPDDAPEPLSAVVLMHGSGGMFATPDANDTQLEVTTQYADWVGLLTRRGHAVLLPSSFYSRGYFEWDDRPAPRIDKLERSVMRVHDAYAALGYLCRAPGVDCDRVAALGFSNGGSVLLLSQYEGLDDVEGMRTLPPAAARGRFAFTTAFYPGCNLHGQVPGAYFPTAPVDIYHGREDPLLEHCPERVEQARQLTEQRGVPENPVSIRIYEQTKHSFDEDPRNATERRARDEARGLTLDRIDQMLER